jgi:hypothetical protein
MKIVRIIFVCIIFSSCNKPNKITNGQNFIVSSELYEYQARSLFDVDTLNGSWNNGRIHNDTLLINFLRPYYIYKVSFNLSSLPVSEYFVKLVFIKKNNTIFEINKKSMVYEGKGNFFQFNCDSNKCNDIKKLYIILDNKLSYIMMRDLKIIGK